MATAKGFTLIELMAVIAIAGILATVAIPAYKDWLTHSAVNNAAATVMAKLKQARNMAVADNRNVTVSFDYTNAIITYDSSPIPPKQSEAIDLHQFNFSKNDQNILQKNKTAEVVFKSDGTLKTSQTSIKVMKGGYYQCITINAIGRAYYTTSDPTKCTGPTFK